MQVTDENGNSSTTSHTDPNFWRPTQTTDQENNATTIFYQGSTSVESSLLFNSGGSVSATDAYAFLIEAEGKRLFYSGDLRSHGRKGKLFENLVQRPIRLTSLQLGTTLVAQPPAGVASVAAVAALAVATVQATPQVILRS